jgi:hypothetical protein
MKARTIIGVYACAPMRWKSELPSPAFTGSASRREKGAGGADVSAEGADHEGDREHPKVAGTVTNFAFADSADTCGGLRRARGFSRNGPRDIQFVGPRPQYPPSPLNDCDGSGWWVDQQTLRMVHWKCGRA